MNMKKILLLLAIIVSSMTVHAKTLVVYYSYTNNVHTIVSELVKQINADVLRIEPAQKGLDYEANNYAIGSAQIAAIRENPGHETSYPAIDPTDVNLAQYDCIIIGAPLWWSNMAAPLQTYLFKNGGTMAGKKIGLIVSSYSSGINGVESDAQRLIPDGDFFDRSLWIRSSQTSNSASLLRQWLKDIDYETVAGMDDTVAANEPDSYTVFSVNGSLLAQNASTLHNLEGGLYIINGKKTYIK
ncbi:MAG: flavodoxin [Muribaculaceae bacterium]|nr:flavodoxin [Muribaculaceae bacterium]